VPVFRKEVWVDIQKDRDADAAEGTEVDEALDQLKAPE
jgi:hypothetical protein